jgi:hypothetical protein
MKKTTTSAWVRGASFALILAGMTPRVLAQGIIYYSPQPPPNYVAGFPRSYDLDVNGDGVADFKLISTADSALIAPLGSNSIVAWPEPPPDYGYLVPALPAGYTIGSSLDPVFAWYDRNTDQFGAVGIGAQEDIGSISFYLNTTAFDGIDLYYDGADHYGWMRIANPLGVVAGQIVDWAYETSPNTPILTGAGVPEPNTAVLLFVSGAAFWFLRKRRLACGAYWLRKKSAQTRTSTGSMNGSVYLNT